MPCHSYTARRCYDAVHTSLPPQTAQRNAEDRIASSNALAAPQLPELISQFAACASFMQVRSGLL